MTKNIVVLCDGTSNEVSTNRTNILRLYGTLKKDETQIVYYDPGVGTFGAENAASYYYRKAVEIWGLLTGWGLDQNVKEAYRFIAANYDHGKRDGRRIAEPDRIFLFGFSRGAYTVRVLAGFIHTMGILPKDSLNLLDYAYRAYKEIGSRKSPDDQNGDTAFAEVQLFQRMLEPQRPIISLLGLFDTVGSVIESGRFGLRLRSHAFTRTNRSVQHVRHAVAMDERRTMFQPQLWPAGKEFCPNLFDPSSAIPQNVKEVWFTGSHGDVGGGYPESKSELAKIPLHWMIEETRPMGLKYKTRTINTIVLGKDKDKSYVAPDALAPRNESLTLPWWPLEVIPRRSSRYAQLSEERSGFWYIPLGRKRSIPPGANIHPSAIERSQEDEKLPKGP